MYQKTYLETDITGVEAELRFLEVEAQNSIVLLDHQKQYYGAELARVLEMVEAGTINPLEAAQMKMQLEEIEARLRLAEIERGILRRELDRRVAAN